MQDNNRGKLDTGILDLSVLFLPTACDSIVISKTAISRSIKGNHYSEFGVNSFIKKTFMSIHMYLLMYTIFTFGNIERLHFSYHCESCFYSPNITLFKSICINLIHPF